MADSAACFDFDGVVLDSATSIVGSLDVALRQVFGLVIDRDKLTGRVGETLPDIFLSYAPSAEKRDVDSAIENFREDFGDRMWTAQLYEGALDMLRAARYSGYSVNIVSTKPQPFLEELVSRYGMNSLVDGVFGGSLDESKTDKTPILATALRQSGADPVSSIMLGDRKFDVFAGKALGTRTFGAAWGYGGQTELSESGCDIIFASPSDVSAYFAQTPVDSVHRVAVAR